jgi:hypothetical protein
MRWRNMAYGRVRNIFIEGLVAFVATYQDRPPLFATGDWGVVGVLSVVGFAVLGEVAISSVGSPVD